MTMPAAAEPAGQTRGMSESELVALCRELARDFAPRAARYDQTGEFPAEDFEQIKDAGLLAIMVPREAGGLGADFLTYTKALEQLAIGNAATGLTFNMHNIVMGGLAEVHPEAIGGWRGQAMADFRDWAFRQAVDHRKVFASATSEPGAGARLTKLKTTYERVEGGFRVRGVKSFVSMAGYADYYAVAALSDKSPADVPLVSYLIVEKNDPGVRFEGEWDVLGMRATSSRNMVLDDVFLPEERLFLGVEGMAFFKLLREPHWLVGGYNGVYLGICTAAFDFMVDYLQRKGAAGDPLVQHRVGELLVQLEAARAVTYEAAALVAGRRGTPEANAAIHRAKYMVGELGPWLASQAIRLCGGSTIARSLPLERLYRDARCGGLMPARSDDCLLYLGKQALGIDVADPSESYW